MPTKREYMSVIRALEDKLYDVTDGEIDSVCKAFACNECPYNDYSMGARYCRETEYYKEVEVVGYSNAEIRIPLR